MWRMRFSVGAEICHWVDGTYHNSICLIKKNKIELLILETQKIRQKKKLNLKFDRTNSGV